MSESNKGITFTFNIGEWGGFYFRKSGQAIRLCLGYVAFTIYFFDLDSLMVPLVNEHAQLEAQVDDAHEALQVWIKKYNRLEAQVEAHRQFAQHKHWCRNIQAPAGAPCDCGLQELLEASGE